MAVKKKLGVVGISKTECNFEKEQLYQLMGLVDTLNVEGMAQCEFLMNFGIALALKKHISYLIQQNNGYINDEDEIAALSIRELLIIYKYLDLAVQKIHKKFIKQELADINTDLLADFKETRVKAKQTKTAIDYRDALKPSINYEDPRAFPAFEPQPKKSKAKPKPAPKTSTGSSIWQKLDKPPLIKPEAKSKDTKPGAKEDFPELPPAQPYMIPVQPKRDLPNIPKRPEIKKLPGPDVWPSMEEAEKWMEKEGNSKAGGKHERKRKGKKQSTDADIQIGFY